MKVQTGYIYHIKDKFFDVVNDEGLMKIMRMVKQDQHILLFVIMIFYGLYH